MLEYVDKNRFRVLISMGTKTFYVYILSNDSRKVLYTGITNNLKRRLSEHREGMNKGFTYKYNVHLLMYYEKHYKAMDAILREKRIKKWYRYQKNALIEKLNPEWKDLSSDFEHAVER